MKSKKRAEIMNIVDNPKLSEATSLFEVDGPKSWAIHRDSIGGFWVVVEGREPEPILPGEAVRLWLQAQVDRGSLTFGNPEVFVELLQKHNPIYRPRAGDVMGQPATA